MFLADLIIFCLKSHHYKVPISASDFEQFHFRKVRGPKGSKTPRDFYEDFKRQLKRGNKRELKRLHKSFKQREVRGAVGAC